MKLSLLFFMLFFSFSLLRGTVIFDSILVDDSVQQAELCLENNKWGYRPYKKNLFAGGKVMYSLPIKHDETCMTITTGAKNKYFLTFNIKESEKSFGSELYIISKMGSSDDMSNDGPELSYVIPFDYNAALRVHLHLTDKGLKISNTCV